MAPSDLFIAACAVAIAWLAGPFVLGAALAATLYDIHAGPSGSRLVFILFVGTAMSVTALPVLTRMLADGRAQQTLLGTVATACAAVDDVAAWTLLGVVAALVGGAGHPVVGAVAIGLYLVLVLAGLRWALAWLHRRLPSRSPIWFVALGGAGVLTLALVLAAASAGKSGAGALAARVAAFPWRDALVIGVLLNTRGLVALVVVDLGRQFGILSPALFATFIVMAFVMTALTVPVCRLLGWPPAGTHDVTGRS